MSGKKGGFAGMLKLGIVLALYAVAACVGLAFVYAGTEKVIAQRQRADLEAALSELFSQADDFKAISGLKSGDPSVTIEEDGVFAAYKNGEVIGAVIRTSRASYNGAIKVLVGVGTNGRISAVKILEHSDTPGLGANAASGKYYVDRAKGIHFYDQFAGKAVSDPFEPKNDVIAITAATITSRAVSASVKAAGEAASAWFAGGAR
jgi:electron transport complex protein RnfG